VHREGNIICVGADVREWLPPYANIKLVFAFLPCTNVAVSGARWLQDKGLGSVIEALEMFQASVRLAEWTKAPYMIENPVSTVSTYCESRILFLILVISVVDWIHLVIFIPSEPVSGREMGLSCP